MPAESVDQRKGEFESHVWNHAEDPFQMEFDTRRPFNVDELRALRLVTDQLRAGASDEDLATVLRQLLTKSENLTLTLLQAVGLTRNKILTDLRGAASGTRIKVPSSPTRVHADSQVWKLAGPYLASRLRNVLQGFATMKETPDLCFEALNQATWPGWVRQERAKRQGHEAECRLANLFLKLDIAFVPQEKADNPLCPDTIIEGASFDLVVPNAGNPLVCAKCTVHTANIGQYGESKDALEIDEASRMLEATFQGRVRPILLVGFRSNRAGLEGVLSKADEFCQFKTLWKAAVVAAACLSRHLTLFLPSADMATHRDFLLRFAASITVKSANENAIPPEAVEAGEGYLLK